MTLLPNVAMAADNESETPAMSGPCGAASSESSVTWELTRNDEDSSNPTYTLTISGTGAMADYDVGGNRAPWYNSLLQKGATTTAYSGKTFVNITKVVIGSEVTHIGAYAFAYTTVSDIQIADGVTSIGKGAFLWANWLKNITIPSSVTNMHYDREKDEYYNIFDGTFYLESVEISGTGSPYQVVQGGVLVGPVQDKTDEYIIINCPDNLGGGNTKKITADGFPTNTTMVAATAFSSCRSLETIILPDTITSLGTSVFAKCLSLKSFKVPDGVTTLPQYAFFGCAELESINFNNVETLSDPVCGSVRTPETDNSTYACSSLKTLVLSKVKEIPANAFPESAIESVTIADQAKVHAKAFLNLTTLKSVTFLGGYTIVEGPDGNVRPFQGCKNIETVTFNSSNVQDAKVTISDNMFVDCTKLTSIDLSKVSLNDEKIGENAFKGCTALSEVKFAANTKTISQNAFSGCTALTAVDLADKQTQTIGQNAFLNCTSLATLSLPATGLTSIGARAFDENAIKHITIPSSVTTIEYAAFANCSALERITMSKDWSGKFSNAVKAPEGYAVGLRWYKDGTQVTTPASCFSSESTTPQTFEYVPIFFFDVEYNGNYSGYSAGTHNSPYRTIYKASNMSVLSAHTVKGYSDSALSITTPEGKSFAGWTLSSSDDGIEVITAGSTFAANPAPDKSTSGSFGNTPTVTLYARWVDNGKKVIANDVIDQSVQRAKYDGAAKSFGVKAAAGKTLPTDVTFTVAYQNAKGESVERPTDAGTYDVTISYSGDNSYAAFQLTIKGGLVITKASSTVTPAESTKTATYGERVELKVTTDIDKTGAANGIAMISANSVPTVNPSTVGFYNGETLLGTAPVTYDEVGEQGTATLNYDTIKKGLSIGENTVTAYYGGNDNLEQSAVAGTIAVTLNKATLTITGLTATDRPYDSTTNVTLTSGILSGVLGGDAVTAAMPTSGTLTDANVGTGKPVSVPTITLTGDHAVYYTLTQPTGLTVNIAKGTQAAPASAPTLKDRTYTSITLNTVEPNANGAVAQYSKDGGANWQSSPAFTGLTSSTSYTFAVRYAATTNYEASSASATASFSTTSGSSSGGETGGSTSGGSSSGSTTTKTETTTNPDGSTTKTETKADGTTVETTTGKDGTTTKTESKTETKSDGSKVETKTETVTAKDGSKTETESKTEVKPDGSSVETKKETSTAADGTKSETKAETKTDANGVTSGTETTQTTTPNGSTGMTTTTTENGNTKTEAEAKISEKAVEDAKKNNAPVTAPVEVKAGESSDSAPTVKIELPENAGKTKVEIPVSDVNSGTVAVIVNEDGTEEIVKNATVTENGVVLGVEGNTTVKIIDNSKDFIDTKNHWSRDEVNFVAARELFNGVGDNLFGVSGDMTRGMVNTVLARLAGEDTNGGANWYDKGTEWAKKNGITDGANPTANITREQLAAMLYRFAGSPAVSGELSFADADQISGYAKDALLWAVQNGILNGTGNNLVAPKNSAERAQVAAMMARYLKNVG